jgi:rhamnose utilization protein RhaD (predicted bifunctional aldolase and dehydrogenase)
MKKEISDLVEISRYYGEKKDFTLGGGGNTSYKDKDFLYVKASGFPLATITEEGFAVLDRKQLAGIMTRDYSPDDQKREQQVLTDLMNSLVGTSRTLRPSVEASLHDLIEYAYVVHTHPYLINALLCSNDAEMHIGKLFNDKVLYVPYTEPGYILSTSIAENFGFSGQKRVLSRISFFCRTMGFLLERIQSGKSGKFMIRSWIRSLEGSVPSLK